MSDIDHPTLGILRAEDNGSWAGAFAHGGGRVTLVVSPGQQPLDATLAIATALVERFADLLARAQAFAERDLRPTWNESWREDEPELDEAAFRARLVPDLLTVDGTDGATVWFADTELFWGHGMVASFYEPDAERLAEAEGDATIYG